MRVSLGHLAISQPCGCHRHLSNTTPTRRYLDSQTCIFIGWVRLQLLGRFACSFTQTATLVQAQHRLWWKNPPIPNMVPRRFHPGLLFASPGNSASPHSQSRTATGIRWPPPAIDLHLEGRTVLCGHQACHGLESLTLADCRSGKSWPKHSRANGEVKPHQTQGTQ